MNLNIQLAKYEEKYLLQNMLELLVYDLSEFENRDLNEFGKYGYRYLDLYWIEPERFPFILRMNEKLVGFALVNIVTYTKAIERTIAEFFVLKKYRHQGIGKKLAFYLFDQFPGKWEVRTLEKNLVAQTFWRKTIKQYAPESMQESLEEVDNWQNIIWTFIS
ncbi:MAG: hypothetical protein RLZZ381_3434 [Cyanobacteriota bacterium]